MLRKIMDLKVGDCFRRRGKNYILVEANIYGYDIEDRLDDACKAQRDSDTHRFEEFANREEVQSLTRQQFVDRGGKIPPSLKVEGKVLCPQCDGLGATAKIATVNKTADGIRVFDTDTEPCPLCAGDQYVYPEIAEEYHDKQNARLEECDAE